MASTTLTRSPQRSVGPDGRARAPTWLPWAWVAFVVMAMLALEAWSLTTWGWVTPVAAAALVAVTAPMARSFGWLRARADAVDLTVVALLYAAIV